ncbi:acyl-CoA carboxylase subunit beta [Nocardia cyriacigeorgica]|uniref:acyl-CoA carboxylase subunit beta n=1 Tax=Nocardia cyriacigeorgica TaxID=135487 RepID=UPI0002D4D2E0|nr:acyl-CoA carboxylase subunit beta [Nocardia cyriacigeorgica]AVH21371.1 acyl-CoA carboxylase subunit beta [Nocardia cyriacigeorgica]MBF6086206.1 acyl-CoA carboxylase subunit beta [Nocardia cyriacigeorgica]MBF6092297.1 acyl-CoA carboxylase subunit beta [Nocardia cyriacigeorgica]MBF6324425.1 acyl-CoA carboxylase subunit beta [Nocardia cyriacigeorgica]MBF6343051.1 acyl-CoA carboxylase subunit beta [Nocardia cyriacigeorgica]
MSTTAEKLADLRKRLELAQEPAGEAGVAKRAKKGIPSARDRINMLLDPGTFVEVGALVRKPGDPEALYGDGVVTGHGLVDGRPVAVFSHDQTVYGGSVGEMFGRKVAGIMEYAHKVGCPVVGINDSGGARVQEAVTSLAWYAELGRRQEPLSGLVPQISMILGKCAGGAVYAPINTDVVVATREAYMFVTGPKVIREVTGEDVSLEELGGANSQAQYGNIHHVAEDEKAAFQWVRDYLGYLPTSCQEEPPIVNPGLEPETTETDLELNGIVPDSDNAGYDMHEILVRIFDDGAFHEVGETAGRNIITGFARVDGRSVGVVANQPMVYAGALDARASDKAAHFVRMCDAFEIPLVFVVDTPGFLPGVEQEKIGVIKRGGRFLFSFVEATVPKVTVVIRKSYGGGYAVMGSKQLGADVNLAWPTARIAVMGAESAVSLIGGKQIAAAPEEQRPAIRQQMIDFYNATVATPWVAAERGYIDAVIEPSATRLELRKALQLLRDKTILRSPRKHHLLPL